MLVLAIDTATSDLVTGLVDTTTGTATDSVIADSRGHNEKLMPTIMALIDASPHALADLDAIVVGHGPGPFTGLRVGMATASALGQALGIPVHGVSTLDAIAKDPDVAGRDLLVATDARRREVYWATYRAGERTGGPEVMSPAQLAPGHPVDVVVVPEAIVDKLPETLRAVPHLARTPRAAGLVACAELDSVPGPLMPEYLRRPDAVPPPVQPRSVAIPEVEL